LLLQESQLGVADFTPKNHALRAAFTRVCLQADKLYKRGIQRKVNAGLIHGGSHRSLTVRIVSRLGGAKVGLKSGQRCCLVA
jgi:hypothetical protein